MIGPTAACCRWSWDASVSSSPPVSRVSSHNLMSPLHSLQGPLPVDTLDLTRPSTAKSYFLHIQTSRPPPFLSPEAAHQHPEGILRKSGVDSAGQ